MSPGLRGLVSVVVLCATPSVLLAQRAARAPDSVRVLVLEHQFGADSAASAVVHLERSIVYWAELSGPGAPLLQPVARNGQPAFVVPIAAGAGTQRQGFEVYPRRSGPHQVRVSDLSPGSTTTLRLYRDNGLTGQIAARRDRGFAVGVVLNAGVHRGYRLDPSGGADPRGGTDIEGCVLAEVGRLGTCFGLGRQAFPDAHFSVTWAFLEERVLLASGRWLGDRRTDVGVALRYSTALAVGPRALQPALLSFGLHVTHHLAADGRRRGTSLLVAWQHSRLGYAPETEFLDSDRFTAGVIWMP